MDDKETKKIKVLIVPPKVQIELGIAKVETRWVTEAEARALGAE